MQTKDILSVLFSFSLKLVGFFTSILKRVFVLKIKHASCILSNTFCIVLWYCLRKASLKQTSVRLWARLLYRMMVTTDA